jgi:rSAM/selenodomain-associated transferase 2
MLLADLSIIIPTLNEAETLPLLLDDLSRQHGVSLEVLVVDGGSTDATTQIAAGLFAAGSLTGRCIESQRGRGRQLNAGASVAQASWLLFLHADCRLLDDDQLRCALHFMKSQPVETVLGRFALRFDTSEKRAGFGLFYYEAKAALGRPGCVHGDQGMLLSKTYFDSVGPFRDDLPVMEDTSLAESVRKQGQLLLMPGEIVTSARRFEVEGLKARQTLNALMMNFLAIGWFDFFIEAPEVYRQQDRTRSLQLYPFFSLIAGLLQSMSLRERYRLWLGTGRYVQGQAWQLGFARDCRQAYTSGIELPYESGFWLNFFDRWFAPLTNHFVGHAITALLVRIWFSWQLRRRDTEKAS